MISALEWNTVEKDAKEAGIADFLPKPLFPSSIIACIQKYFGAKSSARGESAMIEETFAGRHLLLVEDVEINREIVMTMLEPLKLAVDCAVNGIEAVQMFAANPKQYDLIFMDVQMPEMDGLEATRRIRSSGAPNAKKIPIIAMTANVFREDIDKCLEAGMNEHVGKPLDFSEVIEKLRHHFK
jgi:CheY-like chemotaxis protein